MKTPAEPLDNLHAITREIDRYDRAWKAGKLTWLAYARPMRLLKQHYQDLQEEETKELIKIWRDERDASAGQTQLWSE